MHMDALHCIVQHALGNTTEKSQNIGAKIEKKYDWVEEFVKFEKKIIEN